MKVSRRKWIEIYHFNVRFLCILYGKVHGSFYSELGLNPAGIFLKGKMLGKSVNLSGLRFSHLKTRDKNICFVELLRGPKEESMQNAITGPSTE